VGKTDLSKIDLVALMIDGIVIAGHVMLVALGVDAVGSKHVLGGARGRDRERNKLHRAAGPICERGGMRTDRSVLIVIDGGKALASAGGACSARGR